MIYLDHHATTPVDPRVLRAMMPYFAEKFGNAASVNHALGREAAQAVEEARAKIARVIRAKPEEIYFTSGATEADNLALKGVDGPVVTVATEHPAVLESRPDAVRLPVDVHGLVDPDAIPDARLVSVMAANNETGVLQPIAEIGKLCRRRGVLFHTDAAQAFAKVPLDVNEMGIDLMSISAHKIYGPKGVGALYVRKGVNLKPLISGGGHERGLRSGTLPVPLIVGFGAAAELPDDGDRIRALRDRLWTGLQAIGHVTLHGHPGRRLPGNLNVSFAFVESERLIAGVPDVAVSSGSACATAKIQISHVLRAMGVPEPEAHGAIRFGIGRGNTEQEIDATIEKFADAVRRLRPESPLYELMKEER